MRNPFIERLIFRLNSFLMRHGYSLRLDTNNNYNNDTNYNNYSGNNAQGAYGRSAPDPTMANAHAAQGTSQYNRRSTTQTSQRNGYAFSSETYVRRNVTSPDDFFRTMNVRMGDTVFFCRAAGYSDEVDGFLRRYCAAAQKCGTLIEGRLPPVSAETRREFELKLGYGFVREARFISQSLSKWLPLLDPRQRSALSGALMDTLNYLLSQGMTEGGVKNCYVRYMCTLKQSFSEVSTRLGSMDVPKILYDGSITIHDLLMLSTMSKAGCDVLLVEYGGDDIYLNADPQSEFSELLFFPGSVKFPRGYGMEDMRQPPEDERVAEKKRNRRKRADIDREPMACTNAWIVGYELDDMLKPAAQRGNDEQLFYNIFMRVKGVWDRAGYMNELYLTRLDLISRDITPVICEYGIPLPDNSEISELDPKSYPDPNSLYMDMCSKLRYRDDPGLQKLMVSAFMELMYEASAQQSDLRKLTDTAVYMLCWFRRWQEQLLEPWSWGECGCFMLLGGCKTLAEEIFVRFLSRLPIDVVVLCPDRERDTCCMEDKLLYEQNNSESFHVEKYPEDASQVNLGTAAFYAERDLDKTLYEGTGFYRNKQYEKANALILKTMYEEIRLIWCNELKYRPNFSTVGDTVNIPTVFAKISGVKDGDESAYWDSIAELINDDTMLVTMPPLVHSGDLKGRFGWANDPEFFRNGKLRRDVITSHPQFKYGFIREEMLEHMLDKLQLLIDSRMIKGTFTQGAEQIIIAVCLNLDEYIIRKLQSFDFTKTNPKLIYIHTGKQSIPVEDAIIAAYLSVLGCDVALFVPTGYQSMEKHFNGDIMEEHQIGTYLYDLRVPDLRKQAAKRSGSFFKFFKKGK